MTASAAKSGGLTVEVVTDAAGLDDFVRLPWLTHAGDPNWVPPLVMERKDHLNPKKNPFFEYADVRLWVARRDGKPVGRISGQVNHAYLERHGDQAGHFGMFDVIEDPAVTAALFETMESWLREKGMERVLGPFSLSINDEMGLLVDGRDTPPSLMMGHSQPWYPTQVEEQGYGKVKDVFAYYSKIDTPVPRAARRIVKRAYQSESILFRPLNKRRYMEDLTTILGIFNDAWADNWGFVPFSEREIQYVAKELKPLVREKLVCIAELDGEAVAMAICLPNLNEAIADLNGALLPFGWAKLMWRLMGRNRLTTLRLPLMGVRSTLHGTPMGSALAFTVVHRVRQEAMKAGFLEAEMSWVLEDNLPMCRMIETMGGYVYKTYRIYGKELD